MSATPHPPTEPAAVLPDARPQASTRTEPAPTFFDTIWESIATPGAGPGLTYTLNASLCLLLLCLAYFSWRGLGDVHMAVLAALCVGLLVSFNAFTAAVKRKGD